MLTHPHPDGTATLAALAAQADALITTLEEAIASRGWTQPAQLLALHPTLRDGTLGVELVPHVTLTGGLLPSLLTARPVLPAGAVGFVLAAHGWTDPLRVPGAVGAPDSSSSRGEPGRARVRVVHCCLADGTERIAQRGEHDPAATLYTRASGGWVPELLRRAVGLPSRPAAPAPGFAADLVLAWQVSAATWCHETGKPLGAVPDPSAWGRLAIPGSPEGWRFAEPWWIPIGAALDGDALDVDALGAAFRASFATGWPPIPFAEPLINDGEAVAMTPELAEWCDDALLVAFCEAVTPPRANLPGMLDAALGPAWAASLTAHLAARDDGPAGR